MIATVEWTGRRQELPMIDDGGLMIDDGGLMIDDDGLVDDKNYQ